MLELHTASYDLPYVSAAVVFTNHWRGVVAWLAAGMQLLTQITHLTVQGR